MALPKGGRTQRFLSKDTGATTMSKGASRINSELNRLSLFDSFHLTTLISIETWRNVISCWISNMLKKTLY